MSHKLKSLCLALLLTLGACLPVGAAEAEDRPAENTEVLEHVGEYGLFQEGAFFGPQTLPGGGVLLEASEHPGYTAAEERLYREIEAGLREHVESFSITPFPLSSKECLLEIYYQVINDHPEFFYCQSGLGWSQTPSAVVKIMPRYLFAPEEIDELTAEFERCVSAALAQVDGVTDPLEKVLILHDYLVVNCQYAQPIPDPPSPVYSAYGALVDKVAVCQGYSLAFKVLMDRIDVPCVMVLGAEEMNHIWNAVQLDGKWYHMDVTWDDPVPNHEGYCGHNYFLVSNEKLLEEGVGEGCHYGWDNSVVAPWGEPEYDSGWIFNDSAAPIYRWNDSYYYLVAPYLNLSYVYQADSLRAPDTPASVYTGGLERDAYCGCVWRDGRLYYIPYTTQEALHVEALMLDKRKIVQLEEFTREGDESVGLRVEEEGLGVYRANTDVLLGTATPVPEWREFTSSGRTYGLTEDGGYLLLDRSASNVRGKALWVAGYDGEGKMTLIGSAESFPALGYGDADFVMVSCQCSGTQSEELKAFLLDPTTFAP